MRMIFLLILLRVLSCSNSNSVFYHAFEPTVSIPKVIDWNIELNENVNYYIKEEVDSINRVIEIKFYQGDIVYDIWPMYGAPIIRYKYLDNHVYELYYDKDGYLLSYNNSESPFCRIYYLNKENEITSCQIVYYKGNSKIKTIDFTDELVIKKETCNVDYIMFYLFSYHKMNNIFPKTNGFVFDEGILNQVYDLNLLRDFKY
jgi:hypothetical protein